MDIPSTSGTRRNLSDAEEAPSAKKPKKIYAQKYQDKWESEENFKGWLKRSKKGPTFFFCHACSKDFVCGKSEIQKHAQGTKHITNIRAAASQHTLLSMTRVQQLMTEAAKIKEAEIRYGTSLHY